MKRPSVWLSALLTTLIWLPLAHAAADTYPARELKVIVPLSPGGGTDTITRQLTDRLAKEIGKPIIIENKGGAGTTIGMAAAAGAAPDGYTLVVNGDTAAIFEFIFANLKFDVHKDFVPVAYFASAPIVLAAHPSFPANSLKELLEMAKRAPGQINYATPGVGTPHDLAGLCSCKRPASSSTRSPTRATDRLSATCWLATCRSGCSPSPTSCRICKRAS